MRYIIIIAAVLLSCRSNNNAQKVREFVISKVTSEPNGVLDFKKLNSLTWNKLYIVPSYTPESRLDGTLLKYRSEIMGTGIRTRDDINLVLLFNDDDLISMTLFNPKEANFSHAYLENMQSMLGFYKKNEAAFHYKTDKDGFCKLEAPIIKTKQPQFYPIGQKSSIK